MVKIYPPDGDKFKFSAFLAAAQERIRFLMDFGRMEVIRFGSSLTVTSPADVDVLLVGFDWSLFSPIPDPVLLFEPLTRWEATRPRLYPIKTPEQRSWVEFSKKLRAYCDEHKELLLGLVYEKCPDVLAFRGRELDLFLHVPKEVCPNLWAIRLAEANQAKLEGYYGAIKTVGWLGRHPEDPLTEARLKIAP